MGWSLGRLHRILISILNVNKTVFLAHGQSHSEVVWLEPGYMTYCPCPCPLLFVNELWHPGLWLVECLGYTQPNLGCPESLHWVVLVSLVQGISLSSLPCFQSQAVGHGHIQEEPLWETEDRTILNNSWKCHWNAPNGSSIICICSPTLLHSHFPCRAL